MLYRIMVMVGMAAAAGAWTPGGEYGPAAGASTNSVYDPLYGKVLPWQPQVQVVGRVTTNDMAVFTDRSGRYLRGTNVTEWLTGLVPGAVGESLSNRLSAAEAAAAAGYAAGTNGQGVAWMAYAAGTNGQGVAWMAYAAASNTAWGVTGLVANATNGVTLAGLGGVTTAGVTSIVAAATNGVTLAGLGGMTASSVTGMVVSATNGVTIGRLGGMSGGAITGLVTAATNGVTLLRLGGVTGAQVTNVVTAATNGVTLLRLGGVTGTQVTNVVAAATQALWYAAGSLTNGLSALATSNLVIGATNGLGVALRAETAAATNGIGAELASLALATRTGRVSQVWAGTNVWWTGTGSNVWVRWEAWPTNEWRLTNETVNALVRAPYPIPEATAEYVVDGQPNLFVTQDEGSGGEERWNWDSGTYTTLYPAPLYDQIQLGTGPWIYLTPLFFTVTNAVPYVLPTNALGAVDWAGVTGAVRAVMSVATQELWQGVWDAQSTADGAVATANNAAAGVAGKLDRSGGTATNLAVSGTLTLNGTNICNVCSWRSVLLGTRETANIVAASSIRNDALTTAQTNSYSLGVCADPESDVIMHIRLVSSATDAAAAATWIGCGFSYTDSTSTYIIAPAYLKQVSGTALDNAVTLYVPAVTNYVETRAYRYRLEFYRTNTVAVGTLRVHEPRIRNAFSVERESYLSGWRP